jgi:hypothetical protein
VSDDEGRFRPQGTALSLADLAKLLEPFKGAPLTATTVAQVQGVLRAAVPEGTVFEVESFPGGLRVVLHDFLGLELVIVTLGPAPAMTLAERMARLAEVERAYAEGDITVRRVGDGEG